MILKPFRIEDLHKICDDMGDVVGVCTWIDEKRHDSDKLRHDQKCKKMKRSQDMQLIRLRDKTEAMKKSL
ncbi:hypothetical protein Tco_1477159 [Tanacetum coccineum]